METETLLMIGAICIALVAAGLMLASADAGKARDTKARKGKLSSMADWASQERKL